jgi:D-serine deaminase-like pyridoxal phosphate-dependent protein
MTEPCGRSGETLNALAEDRIDWRYKGIPDCGFPLRKAAARGWDALGGDLLMPIMVIRETALAHNLAMMSRYCASAGVSLAPHGKTTMAPELFRRQLDAGAWAITVATVSQARVARAAGVRRILIANEIVEPTAVRWIAEELVRDLTFECYCLVDSVEGVRLMTSALDDHAGRPLPVLLEIGAAGGRAGCRTLAEALAVTEAVVHSGKLALAGIETFEGILDSHAAVDDLLQRVLAVARVIGEGAGFEPVGEILLTGGGSAWFDQVAATFSELQLDRPVRVVLRSGCYLTHDDGAYRAASPFGDRLPGRLTPALELWSAVVSRPEPRLAILNFGRRDAPFDAGLPTAKFVARDAQVSQLEGVEVTALNDQHAYLRLDTGVDLQVGDLVGCGISHPCTAFDKWRLIPLVDDNYKVIDLIQTFF